MKKRTLVCFLIFTLCVFYTAIPNAVFGQEEESSLAEQVIANHGDTLKRSEIQGGFLIVLDVLEVNPTQAALLNAGTIEAVIATPAILDSFIDRDALTDEQIAALDQFFSLLVAKDEGVLALLRDPQVLELLRDPEAIRELRGKLLADDGTTPPDEGTTPPDEGTTPPDEGTTPPDEGTTPPDEGTTPPDEGTAPPDEGTTPPDVGTPPDVVAPPDEGTTAPPVDMEMAEPFGPVTPTNASILGKSRLGGLSLNSASGRQFLEEIIASTPAQGLVTPEALVDGILDLVPPGFLPTKQIRQTLLSERLSAFVKEAPQLDAENFGNAMTPNFTDFFYNDFGEQANQKYLTSDSLHLYTRVPAKVAGVEFALSNGTTKQGTEVTLEEFQADTYQYTFRLEETLAATNLPAWPALNTSLFSGVSLRWATELDAPIYESERMVPVTKADGTTVWEFEADIPADRGSIYYYFEVTLAEPVHFRTLDREALIALDAETVTVDDVFKTQHVLTIDKWVMPDPRNLQFADRGIIEELFTEDLQAAILAVLLSPEVAPLIPSVLAGEQSFSAILNAAPPKDARRIQNLLLRNTNNLTTHFETEFDPLLASVFTVPKNINFETQSLWVAHFDNIADGNFQVKADVLDADGNVLDRIQENIEVDTSAPEADIDISPGTTNTTGYQNGDVYIATAPAAGGAATLNIRGIPRAADIGPGIGYLFYQMIGLDADGNPNPNITPNTWEPLTVENTMLASDIWDAVIRQATNAQIASAVRPLASDLVSQLGVDISILDDATIAGIVRGQTLSGLLALIDQPTDEDIASILKPIAAQLGIDVSAFDDAAIAGLVRAQVAPQMLSDYLKANIIQGPVNMFLSSLGFGETQLLTDAHAQLIVDLIGGTVGIINELVPVTFDASDYVVMPVQAQDAQAPLVGNYGIRAMGIDSLFNVGAYVPPTHLRIVAPNDPAQINRASVVGAESYDSNGDPLRESYGLNTIYANTKDGVLLTVRIDDNPHFLAGIMVEYQDANGSWQPIGMLSADDLAGTQEGAKFTVMWDVPEAVFDAVGPDGFGQVMVRAVATNQLQLTDAEPMPFSIDLDAGVYPPEVLTLEVDEASIMSRNQDSDAPQGTVTINATTLPQTGPRTMAVRFEAKRENDTDWKTIGTATQGNDAGIVDAVTEAVSIAAEGTDAPINTGGNLTWSITVDTKTLEDTITKDSPGARDVSMDDNQYTIRALAVSADNEWPVDPAAAASTMLSVDNVDDVEPLGPTNITVEAVADPDGGYTLRGLLDENDPSVVPQTVKLTIQPEAERKTYESVMLVSDPAIDAALVGAPVETSEGSGVFEITVNIGELGIAGNGTYTLHALAYDASPDGPDEMYGNTQTDASPESTVHVKNYERPDPAVFKLMVDVGTEKNADSGGPQGTFTFTGYSIEQNSPTIESIRLAAKRANDTDWTTIGTGDASTSVDIEDAALPGVLDHLTGIAVEGTEAGNRSVVAIDATKKQWVVSVDTVALALEDTITKDSDAARDASKDDNQYEVRAFAVDASGKEWPSDATVMFSLDNVDDVAPLAPTGIAVTSVDGVDTVFETADDGSYTVGGLVDKYDDAVASPVATFTINPVATRETYESVRLAMYPEGALVGEITETAEGSGEFTVTVDVGTLADGETYLENGTYTFQALAKDEFGNEETDGTKISVMVKNTYRPAPEVLVVAVDPESITQTNPDSGAPQGTIALNARSHEITSPPISGMRYEVKRPGDEAWIDVGTTTEPPMLVSDVSDAELADFVGDIASATASATEANESGEATIVPINRSQTYQEWTHPVDTTMIMPDAEDKGDTITADSPAARDASKDTNQYMVRVTAIAEVAKEPDPTETMSADGITAHFSVDNVDDVSPLGPTNIVAVADVAGMIEANEDGSYTVGGIVDDTVPSPIAIFTTEPTADPMTYASVNLVQTTGDSAETVAEGEAGVLDLTIDVGMLENGTYMFHALAVDEFGNVQTDESPMITVHVLNFRVADVADIAVIAVDGTDVAEPPAEPIPLRNSVTVSFMVANGSLAAEELSGAVNGAAMPSESAEDPENTFSLMVEVGSLVDGVYTPDAVVTKRNGSVAFPVTTVNVDNTGPIVTIESPTEDDTVDSLPTIRATYHDGAGAGVDGETGSLALARLQPPNEAEVDVDQAELEKDAASLVYTRTEPLAGGAYRVIVQVTDNLGNVGEGSAEFAVNGTAPMVAINSPAPGATFDHGAPLISGEVDGIGTEVTTITINDVKVTPEVDGNQFSYTPEDALANGDYKVVVAVTDDDGNTVQKSVVFTVDIPEPPKDTTPPVISTTAPNGTIKIATNGAVVNLSAVVTDEQSDVMDVKFRVADVNTSIDLVTYRSVSRAHIKAGTIAAAYSLKPGSYNAEVIATSLGGTTKHSWTFTLVFDNVNPTISSITPNGTIRTETPTISASATDESGIEEIRIAVFNGQNQQVKGSIEDDDAEGKVGGITRADFVPDNPLTEGTYLIIVDAADPLGNTATARGSFTIDFDTAAPIITMAAPNENARFVLKPGQEAPTVSVAYADAESGIDVESITMVIEGVDSDYKATASGTKITFKPEQKSASQVTHPLLVDTKADPATWVGKYTVRFEVSDKAHLAGYVSDKDKGTREANWTVHTFSFFLEAAEVPLLTEHVANAPNPFKDSTTIRFTLTRQAKVNIVIYDMTLRPVRVLVDGVAEPGKKEIKWDGTSSSGADLARGVYFCQIIVADDIEPEYAILKLALTR